MDYAVRITRTYDELGDSVKSIAQKCKQVIVYQHEGSRLHCHLLLVECKVSTDTLKNYFKKTLGVVDKSDWSFKVCNEFTNKYITYMSKGKYKPSFVKGFEENFIEERQKEWVEKKAATIVAAKKKSKVEYWDIILDIRSQLTFKDTSHIWQTTECEQSYEQIYDMLIKKLEENKIRAADFELKRWMHTIVRQWDNNLKRNILKSME